MSPIFFEFERKTLHMRLALRHRPCDDPGDRDQSATRWERGTRRREADMDVDALSIAALLALAAAWGWLVALRRRAARRSAEARARLKARRRHVPAVSANVRGLSGPPPGRQDDLWVRETEGSPQDRRAS